MKQLPSKMGNKLDCHYYWHYSRIRKKDKIVESDTDKEAILGTLKLAWCIL